MKNLIFALFAIILFVQCSPEQEVKSITGETVLESYQISNDLEEIGDVSNRTGSSASVIVNLGLANLTPTQRANIDKIKVKAEADNNIPFEWEVAASATDVLLLPPDPGFINLDCHFDCDTETWVNCRSGHSNIVIEVVCTGGIDPPEPVDPGGNKINSNDNIISVVREEGVSSRNDYSAKLTILQAGIKLNNGDRIPITFSPNEVIID